MKPSLGSQLQPRRRASLDHVGAQNARLQRRQKRRVLGQNSLFAFGRDGDHEFGVAVEDQPRRRDEFERDERPSCYVAAPIFSAASFTSSIVPT